MPKSKSRQQLPVEKLGIVTIREEHTATSTRIRTWAQRKSIPVEMWRVTHADWPAARRYAEQLNAIHNGVQSVEHEASDEIRVGIKQAFAKLHAAKVSQGIEVEPLAVMEAGLEWIETVSKANAIMRSKGYGPFASSVHARELLQRAEMLCPIGKAEKSFGSLIDEYVAFKCSKRGGRGNRELEENTKREIKDILLGVLKPWIGTLSVTRDKRLLQQTLIQEINSSTVSRGPNSGQPISNQRKKNIARKTSQFGIWLQKHEHRNDNPFRDLQEEFAFNDFTLPKTMTAAQVKNLFRQAIKPKNRKIIPYLSLLCFSTVRPFELADYANPKRRLSWAQFDGFEHDVKGMPGAKQFRIPIRETINGKSVRRSKISYDRMGIISANGVDWLRHYFEELPTKGRLYASRDIFDRVKKDAGIKWVQDYPRHTFLSMCRHNQDFQLSDTLLTDAAGHTISVFRKCYSAPQTPKEVKAFFNIRPETINQPTV